MGEALELLAPRPVWTLALLVVYGVLVLGDPASKDYIDSPITGQGERPANGTTVFISVYLDRLLEVDQQKYGFQANLFIFLSWRDPKAYAEVQNATAAYQNGGSCNRYCNGQLASGPIVQCCDTLWLPTFIFRNVDEFPQGRVQPYYITVSPAGVVTWRVQAGCHYYTPMSMKAFPFDDQDLIIKMQLFNWIGQPVIDVVPSASGLKLFTVGRGDDLSGWAVRNLSVTVTETEFSNQFVGGNVRLSVAGDPAPLLGAPNNPIENFNVGTVVNVNIRIIVTRLSGFFSLGIILPVLVCTALSMLTFFINPDRIDTRLQLVVTLFLALVAIQFVVEQDLPKASYVIPTRQLVIASYVVLALIAIETLVVFNIAHWDDVLNFVSGHRRARYKLYTLSRNRLGDQEGGHTPVMFRSWRRLGGAARKTLRQAGDREDALPTAVARSGTQEIELDSVDTVEERFKASQARAALKEEGGAAQPLSTEASSKPLRWAGLRRYLHFDSNASRLADPWREQMEEADRKWYFLWVAWMVDMSCFAACLLAYGLVTFLIFFIQRDSLSEF